MQSVTDAGLSCLESGLGLESVKDESTKAAIYKTQNKERVQRVVTVC